jgi:hypothetical protein
MLSLLLWLNNRQEVNILTKKLLPLIFAGIFLFFANPITTDAAYDESYDIEININILEDYINTTGELGEASFQLQEDAHELLTETTGIELDHSYIWLNINGVNILAIDPVKPTFF